MASRELRDDGIEPSESNTNEQLFRLIGMASATSVLVAFSAVGYFALDTIPYGVISGLMGATGSVLFLPWFLQFSAIQENAHDDLSTGEVLAQLPGNPQLRVGALGLEVGGIAMIAIGLSLDEPTLLYGAGGGIAVALVIFLIGSVVFGRIDTPAH